MLIGTSILFISGIIICAFSIYFKKHIFKIYEGYSAVQKIHEGFVPPVGGLIISILFYFGCYLLIETSIIFKSNIFFGSIIILLIGLAEDFSGKVSPLVRFVFIFLASFFYVYNKSNLPTIEIGIFQLIFINFPIIEVIFFSIGLTAVSNGMNMIDGMNGLAALTSISIIGALFSILTVTNNLQIIGNEIFILGIGLIVFLLFNFPFGKIFLGDSGAYWIGWLLGVFVIEVYTNTSLNTWGAVLILFYPLFEVIFSFVRKIIQKKSPFKPDINHLHIKLYFFLIGNMKRSIKFNSFVSVCLMPFWAIPSLLIIWSNYYAHLTILFICLMISLYLYYYFTIPSK